MGLRSTLGPLFRTSVSTVFGPQAQGSVRKIIGVERGVRQGVVFARTASTAAAIDEVSVSVQSNATHVQVPDFDNVLGTTFAGGKGPQQTDRVNVGLRSWCAMFTLRR